MSNRGKTFKSTDAIRLTDGPVRELLFRVMQYIERNVILSFGFDFVESSISADAYPVTVQLPHPLGFIPKDILLTSKIGSGDVTFNYSAFTKTTVSVTATGPATIRFLVGTYRSES